MKKIISLILITVMFAAAFTTSAVVTTGTSSDPSANYVVQTAPHEDSQIRMWFNHANVKVHQEDTTSTDRNTYAVYMAKNEYQGTQVTLYSPSVTKSLISANVTDFTAMDGSGATMSADVYYEFYIKCEDLDTTDVLGVTSSSQSFIREGMIPDAMAKISEINRKRVTDPATGNTAYITGQFTLTAGKTQTLYIKIKSELDTPSGWYSGQFNVTDSDGNVIKTATVYAYVWNFEIPEKIHFQTGVYIDYHQYGAEPSYTAAYDYLLDNRICAFAVPGELNSSNPYVTNPRVNSISVQRKTDYSGHLTTSEINAIYNDLSTLPEWDEVKEKMYFYTTDEPTSQAMKDAMVALGRDPNTINTLQQVKDNYVPVANGWPDNPYALVAINENHPYPPGYSTTVAYNSSTGNYLQFDDHSGKFDNVSDAVQGLMDDGACTLWCVQPYFHTPASVLNSVGYTGDAAVYKVRSMNGIISGFNIYDYPAGTGYYFNWDTKYGGSFADRFRSFQQQQANRGKKIKLWNYVCGNETAYTFCNNLIENTGLQEEIMFWQSMQTGATGYLYYGANLWNEYKDPDTGEPYIIEGSSNDYNGSTVSDKWWVNKYIAGSIRGNYGVYGNGVLFYGRSMKIYLRVTANLTEPLGTVRVEHMRDGIEDNEMLYMYREAYGESAMNTIINKVSANVVSYLSMPGFNRSAYPSSMTDEDVFAAVRKELGDAVEAAQVPHEHTWDGGFVTEEPTCTENGVRTYTCTECGETQTEEIPATGHTWDEGIVTTEPTYKVKGVRTFTCTVCGETQTEEIPVLRPMIGDVNGDRSLDAKDVRRMKQYISSAITINDIVAVNSNVYADDAIDAKDLKALKILVAGG